jgi:hypothetical protein
MFLFFSSVKIIIILLKTSHTQEKEGVTQAAGTLLELSWEQHGNSMAAAWQGNFYVAPTVSRQLPFLVELLDPPLPQLSTCCSAYSSSWVILARCLHPL